MLLIDADHKLQVLSNKVSRPGKGDPSRLGWLNIGTRTSPAIETTNGISILPSIKGTDAKAAEAIEKAVTQARSTGS